MLFPEFLMDCLLGITFIKLMESKDNKDDLLFKFSPILQDTYVNFILTE
jgi:hypothetical protein